MKVLLVILFIMLACSIVYGQDFRVEKSDRRLGLGAVSKEKQDQVYKITTFKNAVSKEGTTVQIVDKEEYLTESMLDKRILDNQNSLSKLNEKKSEISKVKGS